VGVGATRKEARPCRVVVGRSNECELLLKAGGWNRFVFCTDNTQASGSSSLPEGGMHNQRGGQRTSLGKHWLNEAIAISEQHAGT